MNRIVIIGIILSTLFLCGCNKNFTKETSNIQNFDALWKIIDEKYCYLDYKNINWDSVYTVYQGRITENITEQELFSLFGEMLAILKDGHVNLYSDFDVSRYTDWYAGYPENFNSEVVFSDRYLGSEYKIAGGIYYQRIAENKVGYMYYGSFSNGISSSNMQYIFDYFTSCEGIIIDVRGNGGGSLNYSELLASFFFTQATHTGYMAHKTGAGHSDFSALTPIYTLASPLSNHPFLHRKVVVLTNRGCYSATNDFVLRMKAAPNVTVIGDKTGGGGGMPLSDELPNGWLIRYSACPMFDLKREHTESGIEPDYYQGTHFDGTFHDDIIEKAIEIISENG